MIGAKGRARPGGRGDRLVQMMIRQLRHLDITIGRAVSAAALIEAYRRVYTRFIAKGYILLEETHTRVRVFEALSKTATFVAKQSGSNDIVGVVSLLPDSHLGLPSEHAFGKEIGTLRASGRRICEVSNQVATDAALEMMRVIFAQALTDQADDVIMAVSPKHVGVYELLGFGQFSAEVRSYSDEVVDPVMLMRMDVHARRSRAESIDPKNAGYADGVWRHFVLDNPFLTRIEVWNIEARKMFSDPVALHELFVRRSNLLPRCTKAQQAIIREDWGSKVFDAVMAMKG